MRLKDLKVKDIYELQDELDEILKDIGFNSKPENYRRGIKRIRIYLDYLASGLRMYNGGPVEDHNITSIHFHRRQQEQWEE